MTPLEAPIVAPPEPGDRLEAPSLPTARRRTNFGVAFVLLPRDQREAIRAVHAWSRAVDDSVDEEPDASRAARLLQGWRADVAALYEREPAAGVTRALAPHVRRFEIPRRYLESLIDGVEMDLRQARYATFAELHRYCYHVAAVVGLVCLRIFGDAEERGRRYAESLGVALQLTNILRDVGSDHARGRIYLPADEREEFGYDESMLGRGERNESFRRLMRFQADRAKRYFETAAREVRAFDRRRLMAAEIMARVYRRLLEKIEQSDFDVLSGEIRVPRIERVWLAATTAASVTLGR